MKFISLFKRKPKYRRLELRLVSYEEADRMIRQNEGKSESEQWVLAHEEARNRIPLMVYLERREKIKK